MVSYPQDPAGNFASDAHRRVMTSVPDADQDLPRDTDSIVERYSKTQYDVLPLSGEAILSILEDLESDGDVTKTDDGWSVTEQGAEVGSGPTAQDGGRNYYE